MNIGKKLSISFIFILALVIGSISITFFNMNRVENLVEDTMDSRVEQIRLVDQIRVDLGMQGLYARTVLIDNSAQNMEHLQQYSASLDDNIAQLKDFVQAPEMEGYWKGLDVANQQFNNSVELLITAINQDDTDTALNILRGSLQEANVSILEIAQKMVTYEETQLNNNEQGIYSAVTMSHISSVIVLVLSLLLIIAIMGYVRRNITNRLKTVQQAATILAQGDLTNEDLVVSSKDELGDIMAVFNTLKNNLSVLVHNIQSNAEQVSASAQQLSASTEEVTASTDEVAQKTQQAADMTSGGAVAAQQSAVAMDETAQGVQRIAEATVVLQHSAVDATETAASGSDIISHAQQQMNTINHSTSTVNELVQKLAVQVEEIENISQVITDITDQTNLLALNAAIEAARAGEAGKGFAVVADEVRKLAEQSKTSATSITALTNEIKKDTHNVEKAVNLSIHSVSDGVTVIEQAGHSFTNISLAVETMTSQIQEISATSEQLSASAEEVSASVQEIAVFTQESAQALYTVSNSTQEQIATMEQVNEVASILTNSATELEQEAHQFKVK